MNQNEQFDFDAIDNNLCCASENNMFSFDNEQELSTFEEETKATDTLFLNETYEIKTEEIINIKEIEGKETKQ